MLLRALDPQAAERLLGAGRRGARGQEDRLEPLDDALLLAREADGVRGQAPLVPLAPDGAVGLERGQELGEDLLLRMARSAPKLLPRDSPAQRVLAVENLEQRQGLGTEAVTRLAVHVPLAGDGRP